MFPKVGDSVKARDFPSNLDLLVLAIAGGRIAIGSPDWPRGANYAVDLSDILEINGVPYAMPHSESQKSKARTARRRTKSAA